QGIGQAVPDSLPNQLDLDQAIAFSLKHQPLVQQSEIDQKITSANIRNRLADWYPQVNFNYNLQHNFVVQTNIIGGNPVKLGVDMVLPFRFPLTQHWLNGVLFRAGGPGNDGMQKSLRLRLQTRIDGVGADPKRIMMCWQPLSRLR